jgi:hypothetical protein
VNRVPTFLIDPTVLKSVQGKASEDQRGDCRHLCQKPLITLGVLESSLNPDGLNARVCCLSSILYSDFVEPSYRVYRQFQLLVYACRG